MFLKSKATINYMSRAFSLELPSIIELLILMDFALKGGKNKLHFKAFALKLLEQNQLNKFSNVIFRFDVVSRNVLLQFREWCRLCNYKSPIL